MISNQRYKHSPICPFDYQDRETSLASYDLAFLEMFLISCYNEFHCNRKFYMEKIQNNFSLIDIQKDILAQNDPSLYFIFRGGKSYSNVLPKLGCG